MKRFGMHSDIDQSIPVKDLFRITLYFCFTVIMLFTVNKTAMALNCDEGDQNPCSIKILAYNIYMRPTTLFANGQIIRAERLPEKLNGYDVIIFSEAFDDEAREKLLAKLKTEYFYASPILGTDRGLEQDGGVVIVSKYPILRSDQRLFKTVCRHDDCGSDKGVIYVKISKDGRNYHIFGSHTQASYPHDSYSGIRNQQFQIIKEFIDSKNISTHEAVIIGGDLNVDKMQQTEDYREMLRILNAAHPQQTGHTYSFDPQTNKLATGNSEYLDYILYSKAHLQPLQSSNEVLLLKTDSAWKEFFWEPNFWDLSDHYPVYGYLKFPNEATISTHPPCQRGVNTCKEGYVWREAFEGDKVCVTEQTRAQTAIDNMKAAERRDPNCAAGNCPYGPNQCLPGYVWREASKDDYVCVSGDIRAQARHDNNEAAARKDPKCATSQPIGMEMDTDRMGMDYKRIIMPAAEPSLCKEECEKDSTCKAFTYVKPGFQESSAVCYLKNGVPNKSANTCCISGVTDDITTDIDLDDGLPSICRQRPHLPQCRNNGVDGLPHM